MKTKIFYILAAALFAAAAFTACANDDTKAAELYIESIYPESGEGGDEVLINGTGFPLDITKISAAIAGVQLTVLGSNEEQILVSIPDDSGLAGSNPVVVTVGGKSVESSKKFTYTGFIMPTTGYSRTVITLAGVAGERGYRDGAGEQALFSFTTDWGEDRRGGIVVDDDLNVFVADPGNMRIRKIAPDGTVSTYTGTYTDTPDWGLNWRDGGGTTFAEFRPCDLGIDNKGWLYTVDNWIGGTFMIDSDVKTFYMGWGNGSGSLAVDHANNRFFTSNNSSAVYMKNLDSYGADPGPLVEIISGKKIGGMAVDPATGDLYAAAFDENKIYKYAKDDWSNPVLIAGNGNAGYKDGPAAEAEFSSPWKLCFDSNGNLLVAGNGTATASDNADQSIRYINLETGTVSTFAGAGSAGNETGVFYMESYDGVNFQTADTKPFAAFRAPSSVAVDKNGDVYVLDRGNGVVKKIITVKL